MTLLTRRSFVKLLGAGAAGAMVSTVPVAKGSAAGLGWCRADPIVLINGRRLDIGVESYLSMLTNHTGPVQIQVLIPEGSTYSLIYADNGFGSGYDVRPVTVSSLFRTESATQYRVRVYAPSSGNELVRIFGDPLDSEFRSAFNTGLANDWVSVTGRV